MVRAMSASEMLPKHAVGQHDLGRGPAPRVRRRVGRIGRHDLDVGGSLAARGPSPFPGIELDEPGAHVGGRAGWAVEPQARSRS